MQAKRIIPVTWIAIFIACLVAPTIEQFTRIIPLAPVTESRAKVPLPPGQPIAELWKGRGYFSAYEQNYNDVFGFRDAFIRARNQLEFSLFHRSDQAVVGRDGWLIDRVTVEVQQRTADDLNDEQWSRLKSHFVQLREVLRRRGVFLLVIPVPLKNTVYPDKFPEITARRKNPTGEQRLRQLLTETNVPFVDAYRILSEKRRESDVYYKTDIHWNFVGARAVAAATVQYLDRALGKRVPWRYGDAYHTRLFEDGGISASMALIWPLDEQEPVLEAPQGDECGRFMQQRAADLEYVDYTNTCAGGLPPTVVLGNSFMQQMTTIGFQDHFVKLYRFLDLTNFRKLSSTLRPGTKVLIWQLFESEIGYQLQGDEWWADVEREASRPGGGAR